MDLVRDPRKNEQPVMQVRCKNGISYLTFPKLDACEIVRHLFTTREGGMSTGQFRSMNFSVSLGDDRENVLENYRRVAGLLGCDASDVTGTVQTHTTNIRRVEECDRGKVAVKAPDYGDVDGLVTNVPGIALAAFTADCVPIFFVDPVRKAIGLAHSGWRGTVSNMAGKMVKRMEEEFGTKKEDLICAIGPSICRNCYEVDETVAAPFRELLGDITGELMAIDAANAYPVRENGRFRKVLEDGKAEGKYQLDLWLANLILLVRAGVLPERVDVTDLCTADNKEVLFSHRASQGKRGNLGAFLMLKDE
ncbi:MAG: peptidoglycan editing factor PgeF [Lachnospiraceae bacterium]|nr:peptidoglycan editing factor PgeF [Lachnospiraceae bacterium]